MVNLSEKINALRFLFRILFLEDTSAEVVQDIEKIYEEVCIVRKYASNKVH